jgi:ActR/RegA family two-component response regulator
MVTRNRTLLVVEDDRTLNLQYKLACQLALRELGFSAAAAKDAVKQALNLSEAKAVLEKHNVDFVSIDIALAEEEESLNEEARQMIEPGGMALLKELQGYEKQPISIVVTGEEVDSYVLDVWREYGVLNYYRKGSFDIDKQYKNAVKAAMWYWDAAELIAEPETELDIEAAAEIWREALKVAEIAGVRERDFPETLGYKIKLTRENRTHSVTRFPVGRWTEEKLKRDIVGCRDWMLIRVTIEGFDRFIRAYPSQEEPILAFVAKLLKEARDILNDQKLFIGQLGYHVNAPFVIIPGKESLRRVEDMNRWVEEIQRRFEERTPDFASAFGDRQLSLKPDATVWIGTDADGAEPMFTDLHQLIDALGPTQM